MPASSDLPAAPASDDAPLRLTPAELARHLDQFTQEYLAKKSPETVGTYRRSLHEFERYVAAQRGRFAFREDDVAEYKRYLMEERELSQVSVSTYLTALRRLCQYLVETGALAENPARTVKGNRRPAQHSRGVLAEHEIARVFETVGGGTILDLRDRALMALMLYAGLAEIELVRADREDLDQTLMGTLLRVQGKGHRVKDQQVPLDASAADPLFAYLAARGRVLPAEPLFVGHGRRAEGERLNTRTVRSRVNAHLRAAGLKRPGISPHSLTHTAPLLWLEAGMEVDEVRRRMRHGTLDTTMIYFRKQGLLKRKPDADHAAD